MWPSSFRALSSCSTTSLLVAFGKQFLLTFVVVIASATIVAAQTGSLQEPVQPVNIILDDDMSHNADDTGDHAMLWAMAARGEAIVLALIISSTNDYSAPCAHVIATYYGHPNISIGANKENIPNDYAAYFSYYTQQVAAHFGNPSETRFDYPDAVTVYRQALAGAADHSVYIVSGGYYRPLMKLLQSGPDGTSPLTGMQLVTQKVVRLIIVAGSFPDSGTTDRGNMLIDPDSGTYVVANWPVELVWMPDDQAWDVITGPAANADPNTNPVAMAYQLYCNGGGSAPNEQYCANNTPAWTQLGLLYGVRGGLGTNFVAGGRDGSTVVWDSATSEPGRIIWSQTPDRDHSYLLKNIYGANMMAIINPLVQWIPGTGPITQPPVANPQSVTVSGVSAAITLTASDPQGAALTYQVVTGPSHGVLSGATPRLTYTPTVGYTGPDSFTFTASNAVFTSNIAAVSITVTANQSPTANSQTVTSNNGASLSITLTATDSDGDPLTYALVTQPQHGSLTGTPPNVMYTPTPGYSGSDNFTFVANDGFTNSNIATVAITVTLSSGLQEPVEPVNLIMDSDLAHSADDVGDHAMLWALAARGEVHVLALVLSSTNDYSAPCAHAIASYYGHPNVLIGANQGTIPGTYAATSSAYTQQCTNQFGTPGDTRANYPNATTAYRQALANAPDNSVYIVNGGFYRPMYDLLQSGPDAISPLTGLQLVAQKVRRAVLSGGRFPDSGSSPEGNLANDPDSGSYVIANWPTEIVWLGYDEGWNVITGPATTTDPATNPIALAYNIQCQNGTYCANNAGAWTQIALLYAVRGGFSTNFIAGGLDGSTVVWDSTTAIPGRSTWSQTPDRQQSYLQKSISATAMAAILNSLVQWIPSTTAPVLSGLTLTPNSVTGGNAPSGAVALSAAAPAGDVQVTLTSSNTATATVPPTVTVTVGANSTSFSVATYPVTTATSVTISASYLGTTLNAQLTVQPAVLLSQTISFAALPPRTYGDPPLTVSATASSGLPVTFTVGATDNCSISGALVTLTAAGACTVTAHQAGNSTYDPAPDVPQTFAIAKAAVTIQLAGLNAIYDGTAKSVTATTIPSGVAVTITYSGSATAPSNAGTYAVVATINDNNYQGTATGTLVISAAATAVAFGSSLNPSVFGQSVSFTATVSSAAGTPTGSVTFYDGNTVLGTGTLSNGAAVLATSALFAATHTMTVVYGGGTNFQGSTSPGLSDVVNPAATSTTLSSSPSPSLFGQAVTLTATVSATNSVPAGTVTFYDGTTVLGSSQTNGSGRAVLSITTLALGSHSLRAAYAAGGNWLGSTSSVRTQTVNRGSSTTMLTSSVNPSSVGQQVTFTAAVVTSGAVATGTVQFRDGGSTLATVTLDSTGQASFTTSSLAPGTHPMRVVYSGDTRFQSSTSSSLTQTVTASTTTNLISSRNPSNRLQRVTFTATVSATTGIPTGTVTFMDGTTVLGSASLNSARQASFSTSTLSRGRHSITAVYGGTTGFLPSTSAPLTQQVN